MVADIHAVTNPGSAFERITDLSRGSQDAQNIQSVFESWKSQEAQQSMLASRGKVGIMHETKEGAHTVVKVFDNSPAAAAGVRVGDKIVKVDGNPAAATPTELSMSISGAPGTPVELTVIRNEVVKVIKIVRGAPDITNEK